MTRERWAQIGITTQFLIVVRTIGEIFRLRQVQGMNFSGAIAMQYLGGDLVAVLLLLAWGDLVLLPTLRTLEAIPC